MKKIFWTSVFRIVVVFLFRSYVRLFDHQLGTQIGGWFGKSAAVCISTGSGTQLSGLDQQLSSIQTQLNDLAQKISGVGMSSPVTPAATSFATTVPTKIALYYFNQKEDAKLPLAQQINVDSILPIYRTLAPSGNLLKDTIQLLLQGALSASEKDQGYSTEFPNAKFRLLNADLQTDGTLVLEFTDVPGFTDGGSARMLILANSISKTAMQFPGVKKVEFTPETLFQP